MTKEQIKKKLKLDEIGNFKEGRAWVAKNSKCGHVDLNSKVTTPIVYGYVSGFQEGRAAVEKNNKWGHVDLDGNITTPIIYDGVSGFQEGRVWVEIKNFGFYINRQGCPTEHEDFYKLIKGIFIGH